MKTGKLGQALWISGILVVTAFYPTYAHGRRGGGGHHGHRGGHHRNHTTHMRPAPAVSAPTAQTPAQPHYQEGIKVQPAANTPAAVPPQQPSHGGEGHDRR